MREWEPQCTNYTKSRAVCCVTEAGSTYREHPRGMREFRNLFYGNTVAKSVCSWALSLLSLVYCVLWHLPELLEAEQAAVVVPVQHTLLKAHFALASAKKWGIRGPHGALSCCSSTASRTQASLVSALHVGVHSNLNLWCFCLMWNKAFFFLVENDLLTSFLLLVCLVYVCICTYINFF